MVSVFDEYGAVLIISGGLVKMELRPTALPYIKYLPCVPVQLQSSLLLLKPRARE